MDFFILIFTFTFQMFSLEAVAPPTPDQIDKTSDNKLISMNSACSRKSVMVIVVMEEPFYGTIYARGYPMECRVLGTGSRELKLTIGVDECGTKMIEMENGTLIYEVLLYIQRDRQVQLASDEHITLRCTPIEIVVTSGTGLSHAEEYKTINAQAVKPPDYWMDILKGRMPIVKSITDSVNVGEEITMIIRIRRKSGLTAQVTTCLAHDGSRETQQELTDKNGCTLDSSIFPEFEEKTNSRTNLKIVYVTFPAFKFPDRGNLHLQCRILLCNGVCPVQSCLAKSKRSARSSNGVLYRRANILDEFNVFNSVEVKAPAIDESELIRSKIPKKSAKVDYYNKDLMCLSSTKIVIVVLLLLTVLMVSLVVTICMCVRTRELRRRISQRMGMPYGRVMEFT